MVNTASSRTACIHLVISSLFTSSPAIVIPVASSQFGYCIVLGALRLNVPGFVVVGKGVKFGSPKHMNLLAFAGDVGESLIYPI